MWLFGLEVSVAELLTVSSGAVVLVILYLAYEIFKLKTIEKRLEVLEENLKTDESSLSREASKFRKKK